MGTPPAGAAPEASPVASSTAYPPRMQGQGRLVLKKAEPAPAGRLDRCMGRDALTPPAPGGLNGSKSCQVTDTGGQSHVRARSATLTSYPTPHNHSRHSAAKSAFAGLEWRRNSPKCTALDTHRGLVAAQGPVQFKGSGALKRLSARGGAAYGTPRNWSTCLHAGPTWMAWDLPSSWPWGGDGHRRHRCPRAEQRDVCRDRERGRRREQWVLYFQGVF